MNQKGYRTTACLPEVKIELNKYRLKTALCNKTLRLVITRWSLFFSWLQQLIWTTDTKLSLESCLCYQYKVKGRSDDGEGHENIKNVNRLDIKLNNNFARAIRFFVLIIQLIIFLPSLHEYNVKVPNITFCGGRKQVVTKFYFPYWTWELNSKRVRLHLQSKWVKHLSPFNVREFSLLQFLSDGFGTLAFPRPQPSMDLSHSSWNVKKRKEVSCRRTFVQWSLWPCSH